MLLPYVIGERPTVSADLQLEIGPQPSSRRLPLQPRSPRQIKTAAVDVKTAVDDDDDDASSEVAELRREVRRLREALARKIRGGQGKFVCGSQFRGVDGQKDRPKEACRRCLKLEGVVAKAREREIETAATVADHLEARSAALESAAAEAFKGQQARGREVAAQSEVAAEQRVSEKRSRDALKRANEECALRVEASEALMTSAVRDRDDALARLAKAEAASLRAENATVSAKRRAEAGLSAAAAALAEAKKHFEAALSGALARETVTVALLHAAKAAETKAQEEEERRKGLLLKKQEPEVQNHALGQVSVVAPVVKLQWRENESTTLKPPFPIEKIKHVITNDLLPRYTKACFVDSSVSDADRDAQLNALAGAMSAAVEKELRGYDAFSDYDFASS